MIEPIREQEKPATAGVAKIDRDRARTAFMQVSSMIAGDRIRLARDIPSAQSRGMNFDLPLSRREAIRARRRRPSTIKIPSSVSPPVALVFQEMKRQRITYAEVEEKSGVQRPTLKAWRHRNKPGLDSLEAVLGVLGWDFVPMPRAKVLDPEIVAALQPIAEAFSLTMPATLEVLVALVARIHERVDAPSTAPTLEEIESA